MKKDRVSNHKRDGTGVLPFPPLPVQIPPVPQPRSTNRAPLVIGTIMGVGLIAFFIYAVPWSLVSQTLTGSFDSLSDPVKQVQFAQVKQAKKASDPPEVSTPATLTDETAPTSEASTPATSVVATTTALEVLTPETPIVETPSTPEPPALTKPSGETSPAPEVSTPTTQPVDAASAPSFPEPDPRLLVGRYPVRKYTDIRHKIAPGETLYNSFGYMAIGFFLKNIGIGNCWRDITIYVHLNT